VDEPFLDVTYGPLDAPEIAWNPITSAFWMTWRLPSGRIDLKLRDKGALRAMIRSAFEAVVESERQTAVPTEAGRTTCKFGLSLGFVATICALVQGSLLG
jgi:hypothetical protein